MTQSKKHNVILLGGSNSVSVQGLQKGLKEGIARHNAQIKNMRESASLEPYVRGGGIIPY